LSDNYASDKYDSDNMIYNSNKINNIQESLKDDENDQISFNAKKILNNLIENENVFQNNYKDFIDEEIEKERKHSNNYLKKSIADGNINISAINNMTLSYSISSNEKSEGNLKYYLFSKFDYLKIFKMLNYSFNR